MKDIATICNILCMIWNTCVALCELYGDDAEWVSCAFIFNKGDMLCWCTFGSCLWCIPLLVKFTAQAKYFANKLNRIYQMFVFVNYTDLCGGRLKQMITDYTTLLNLISNIIDCSHIFQNLIILYIESSESRI